MTKNDLWEYMYNFAAAQYAKKCTKGSTNDALDVTINIYILSCVDNFFRDIDNQIGIEESKKSKMYFDNIIKTKKAMMDMFEKMPMSISCEVKND